MNRATRLGFAGGLAIAVLVALALRLVFLLTPHVALGRYALRIRLWDARGVEPTLRPRAEDHGTRSRWLTLTEIDVQPVSPDEAPLA